MRRITHSSIARTLVTLVTSACMAGTGSGLVGVAGGEGANGAGAAPVLSFFSQPGTADVGQTLGIIQVVAQDSLGRIDTTFIGVVTVSLASNATGAGLRGTTAVRASDGIATFNDLAVDRPGTYTLRANANRAGAVTSTPFTIRSAGTP